MAATSWPGLRPVAVALAGLATAGCMFRAGQLPPVANLPAPPAKPLVAHVQLDIEWLVNDETWFQGSGDPRYEERIRNAVMGALEQAGYFSQTFEDAADIDVLLHFTDHETGSVVSGLLTIFSMYIIPTESRTHYRLEAKVHNPVGDRVWRTSAEESSQRWVSLLFLVGSPFAWPPSVEQRICEDLARSVLRDLQRDGAFNLPAP
jgi:hypothetical protein